MYEEWLLLDNEFKNIFLNDLLCFTSFLYLFILPFIPSFIARILGDHTIPGTGDSEVNKIDQVPTLTRLHSGP